MVGGGRKCNWSRKKERKEVEKFNFIYSCQCCFAEYFCIHISTEMQTESFSNERQRNKKKKETEKRVLQISHFTQYSNQRHNPINKHEIVMSIS